MTGVAIFIACFALLVAYHQWLKRCERKRAERFVGTPDEVKWDE
jgi:hypothetical protein